MELKFVQNIIEMLNQTDIREFEMEEDEVKLFLKKGNRNIAFLEEQVQVEEPLEIKEYEEVKSQYIGKFVHGTDLRVGKEVKTSEKLGYVDSMGIKTDVIAQGNGIISEILVEDLGIADFGKILIKIEKN
ncbi:MAG: hypothetical protein JXM74_02095 [Fusobacteriaceae bacterium]|nr:hypothetical protein [Fusobacteriaceae bacterium]MBN2837527.1 hypothetical protein [Fusobacteriaceae bacterium]